MAIMKLLCRVFGHEWRYNFPSTPNKRICVVCKDKSALNLKTLAWDESFITDRSNKELIDKWFKLDY